MCAIPSIFKALFIWLQAFKLESPSWLKYLQIRQLSHHGMEAVCALNDVCVYGKSAAEDLEDRLSQEPPTDDPQEAGAILENEQLTATPVTLPKAGELPDNAETGSEDRSTASAEVAGEANVTEEQFAPDKEGFAQVCFW